MSVRDCTESPSHIIPGLLFGEVAVGSGTQGLVQLAVPDCTAQKHDSCHWADAGDLTSGGEGACAGKLASQEHDIRGVLSSQLEACVGGMGCLRLEILKAVQPIDQ